MFKVVTTMTLVISSIVLSAVIIKDGVFRIPSLEVDGNIYLRVDSLYKLNFDFVSGRDVVYLMYGKHTFTLRRDGTVVVDFIEKVIEKGCFFTDDTVYISKDIISEYLNLLWYRTPKGDVIGLKNLPSVSLIPIGKGKVSVKFNGDFCPEMVEVSKLGKAIQIRIGPVLGVENSGGLNYEMENHMLKLELFPEVPFIPKKIFTLDGVMVEYDIEVSNFFGKVALADGIIWRRTKETCRERMYIVDYVDIDLDRVRIEPVIADGGIGNVETVKSMVDRTGAIVGINANYFDPKTGMIVGLLVKNGKVLSGRYGYRPILFITEDGRAVVSNDYMEIVASLGDVSVIINAVNAPSKMDVVMYSSEYSKRIPKDDWRLYFLIRNGTIVSRSYKPHLLRDEILIGVDRKYRHAFENVKIGDSFDLAIRTTIGAGVRHAIEGGPFLIKGGLPLSKPKDEKSLYGPGIITSRRARTIVAVKNSKAITFIIVEDGGNGMNYDDMVSFLRGKGYQYAMCLDGGSSSTLVIKGKVVNIPPDRSVPKVPVGLLVWGEGE